MANQEFAEVLVARRPRLVNLGKVWHVLRTWPIIPIVLLSLVLVSGVAAPWIAPHDPVAQDLGHTFAHALEAETGYSEALLHGEAVAVGLCLAFDLSQRLGLCPAEDAGRVRL